MKDYTGLKIQVLQGGANQQETQELEYQEQAGADNGKSKGPWNKPVSMIFPKVYSLTCFAYKISSLGVS